MGKPSSTAVAVAAAAAAVLSTVPASASSAAYDPAAAAPTVPSTGGGVGAHSSTTVARGEAVGAREGIQTFGLAPTSSILLERHARRAAAADDEGRRRLQSANEGDDTGDRSRTGREEAYSRLLHRGGGGGGVYAGLTELDSESYDRTGRRRLEEEQGNYQREAYDNVEEVGSSWWEEYVEEHNSLVRDFNSHRRLSRFEREYRTENGLSLDVDDNGDEYYEEGEEEEESSSVRRRRLQGLDPAYLDPQSSQQSSTQQQYPPQQQVVAAPYQSAPLSQGYGTHYSTVWVGSPSPQRKSVIVDTGSHYTAFPCKGCQNCGEEHHTDAYYDPDLSGTFRVVKCGECGSGARCDANRCIFSQSYTEGSSWRAYQATDKFFAGGGDIDSGDNPVDRSFGIDFMFGCQTSETGLFVTQLADGIMGMSAHEATLPKQMWKAGKIAHNLFTLCFRQELSVSKEGINAGIMSLGGIDSRLNSSPMVYARNMAKSGWYTVYVKNVYLRTGGGQSARTDDPRTQHVMRIPVKEHEMNSGKGVIVDSGTTDTYLHKTIARSFGEAWREVTGKKYSNAAIRLSREELLRLPTVLLQIRAYTGPDRDSPSGGANVPGMDALNLDPALTPGLVGPTLDPRSPSDVLLAVPATHYMEYSPTRDVYTSRLYFTESRGGVLGANAMQGHNVLFDWENGRVGFAESTCEFTAGTVLGDDSASVAQARHGNDGEEEAGGVVGQGISAAAVGGSDVYSGLNLSMGRDCLLTPPALEGRCVDSVDLNACGKKAGGPNSAAQEAKVLTGTESFSSLVTHGGFGGAGCEGVMRAALSSSFDGEKVNVNNNDIAAWAEVGSASQEAPAAKSESEQQQESSSADDGTEVVCDDSGLCVASRPCVLTCAEAADAAAAAMNDESAATAAVSVIAGAASSTGALDDNGCGTSRWSACSATCVQSQITTVPVTTSPLAAGSGVGKGNKGKAVTTGTSPADLPFVPSCREDTSYRTVRSCHVDSCGRSDPCRVPFVVHAVLGLGGTDPALWDGGAEEALREALSLVVNGGRKGDVGKRVAVTPGGHGKGGMAAGAASSSDPSAGSNLFGPGDVQVLMAGPWYPNEYARDAAGQNSGESVGTKIVVEISVYNPDAVLPDELLPGGGDNAGAGTGGGGAKKKKDNLWGSAAGDSTGRGRGKDNTAKLLGINLGISTGTSRVGSVEGEGVDDNGNAVSPNGVPLATCEESDLYPLAKRALDVHVELGRTTFVPDLIKALQNALASPAAASASSKSKDLPPPPPSSPSPFAAPLSHPTNAASSALVTSWTIRTDANGGSGGLHDHLLHDPRLRSKSRFMFYLSSTRFWTGVTLMVLSLWTLQQSFVVERIVELPAKCVRPCVQRLRAGRGGGLGEISEVDDLLGEETWEVDYDRVPLRSMMDRSRSRSKSRGRSSRGRTSRGRNGRRSTSRRGTGGVYRDEDVTFELT